MKNKKPDIRFKGFSEEWEEKELGEVADFIKGRGYSKNDLVESGTPIILYGRLYTNYQTVIDEVDTFALKQQGSIYSNGNEVIVPASGETAEDIARASAVIKSGVLLGGDLNIIYPSEEINSIFLALTISNGKTQIELSRKAQGKSVVHLRNGDLEKVEIGYPNKTEQTQIGNFFKNLDNLINLHQRKYEKLGILKKAMLEKMFPKNGADVPEIRFKGFSGAWEEKTLGEIAEIKTGPFGSTLHAEDYVEDGEPIITTEHFKSGELPNNKKGIPQVSSYDYSRLKSYLLKSGDIVFSRVGSVDINAHVKDSQDGWLFSGRVLRVRTTKSIDSEFLHQELSTTRVRNNVIMRAVGQTMPSINTEILRITPVQIPKNITEQEKIGNYFKNLDNLLTLHRGELDKLKNLKKALLEKMFV